MSLKSMASRAASWFRSKPAKNPEKRPGTKTAQAEPRTSDTTSKST